MAADESTVPGCVATLASGTGVGVVPVCKGAAADFEAACEEPLDKTVELSVWVAEVPGEVLRGVGNSIGVTATTSAVSNSAIESLLSIYGTGSKPPGRKG